MKNLNYDDEYCRKVLPFIIPEYFHDRTEKLIFSEIEQFVTTYGNIPSYEALVIQLTEKSISEEELSSGIGLLDKLYENKDEKVESEWLLEKTEGFCQDQAIYNAVLESISILDGKTTNLSKGAIPGLLSQALGVSFDNSVGHDYLEDADARYEYYHKIEDRVPLHIEYFQKITNNGFPKKTLNIILAPPHGGKSLIMCDLAANIQLSGKNVLYISCEMAEEEIAKRIDANILNISMDELELLDKKTYSTRINRIKEKTIGKFFIKEYPTASAGVNHFRTLLNELRLKKNFVPDIIFIDYLNICISSRMKMSGSINSYTYIKSIGEELRGLAQEFNLPIVTATQTNKSGFKNSDVDMDNVSESFGINAIADFMVAIINTDELYDLNQILIKQIKNRYRNLNLDKRFVVGVDRSKMRLYNVETSAQQGIIDAGKAEDSMEDIYARAFDKKKNFDGFIL